MKNILHIVDSHEYVRSNCFQHQLLKALNTAGVAKTCDLNELRSINVRNYDYVVSTLRLRTLYRQSVSLARLLHDTPIVVYDQDVWESFKDGGQFKGAYSAISNTLNVTTFAVTSEWWSHLVIDKGFPSTFVRMWVLPEYCNNAVKFSDRKVECGFIGGVWEHRKRLFSSLSEQGIVVEHGRTGLRYNDFLNELSTIKFYVHCEDVQYNVDGIPANIGTGLWVKDIEAAARGCYSIRDHQHGVESYASGIDTIRTYKDVKDIINIVNEVSAMNVIQRQECIDRAVEKIRKDNAWLKTAEILLSF